MRAIFSWPCLRLALGVLLALLAGGSAPTPAQAGCGEHIVIVSTETNESSRAVPVLPAKKHAPCSGPHCTRSPLAPLSPPTVPPGPNGQEWAYTIEPSLPSANPFCFSSGEESPAHPLFVASSVYHPPR